MHVSLPAGIISGTVRLPLGSHAANSVNVFESGALIWAAGIFKPGAAVAVRSAMAWTAFTDNGVAVEVGSGEYNFTVELDKVTRR